MSKFVREQYQDCVIGYAHAIMLLMQLGFTEFAADQFLFEEG